jgi:hypothetical protein
MMPSLLKTSRGSARDETEVVPITITQASSVLIREPRGKRILDGAGVTPVHLPERAGRESESQVRLPQLSQWPIEKQRFFLRKYVVPTPLTVVGMTAPSLRAGAIFEASGSARHGTRHADDRNAQVMPLQ